MAMPHIDDPFIRRFTLTAIHLRRYVAFYGIGMVWLAVLLFVPGVRNEVANHLPGAAGSTQQAAAAPGATSNRGSTAAPVSIDDLAGEVEDFIDAAPDSVESSSSGLDTPSVDTPETPEAPSAAGPGTIPDEVNPALLAVSPVAGEACNTIGTTALLVTLLGPAAPVPVPFSTISPYMTNVYLACSEVPRLSPRGVCAADSTLPQPLAEAGLPVALAPLGLVFDQLRALEIAATTAGAPNAGVAGTVMGPAGCKVAGS